MLTAFWIRRRPSPRVWNLPRGLKKTKRRCGSVSGIRSTICTGMLGYQFYQVIAKDPKQLRALLYLNQGLESQSLSTAEYLARWESVLPKEHQSFANQIAAVFGFSLGLN